jgi:hypothetical protein
MSSIHTRRAWIAGIAGGIAFLLVSLAAERSTFQVGFTEYSGVQVRGPHLGPNEYLHDVKITNSHGFYSITGTQGSRTVFVVLAPSWPFLVLASPFAFVTAIGVYRGHRSEKWMKQGRCGSCGYDLPASSDRCPECGSPIAAKT